MVKNTQDSIAYQDLERWVESSRPTFSHQPQRGGLTGPLEKLPPAVVRPLQGDRLPPPPWSMLVSP